MPLVTLLPLRVMPLLPRATPLPPPRRRPLSSPPSRSSNRYGIGNRPNIDGRLSNSGYRAGVPARYPSPRSLLQRWTVTVSIRDAQNSPQDRTWIQAQYPEYLEDLSQQSMNTGMFPARGEYGEREQELMARWFADETSHPLIILKNDKPAGFALVSRPPRHQRAQVDFRMADFFITLRSRRLGIGRDAAALIFNRFAGTWEIVEFVYNKAAVSFWRAIVGGYTGGKFRETLSQGEVHQVFTSGKPRAGK